MRVLLGMIDSPSDAHSQPWFDAMGPILRLSDFTTLFILKYVSDYSTYTIALHFNPTCFQQHNSGLLCLLIYKPFWIFEAKNVTKYNNIYFLSQVGRASVKICSKLYWKQMVKQGRRIELIASNSDCWRYQILILFFFLLWIEICKRNSRRVSPLCEISCNSIYKLNLSQFK